MNKLFKTAARAIAAIALCAAVSACGQVSSVPSAAGNFPAYNAPSVGHFVAPTIMDF